MSQLREALHDLAERREPGVPPPDLWSRGVRRRRRRVTVSIAAVVLVLGLGGVLGAGIAGRDQAPPPSGGQGRPGIPSRIYVPSPKIAGTAEKGPLGRLALVASASRAGTDGYRVFGVSAATGEYRFLDLPDQADPVSQELPVALSPDGRRVAYWITGGAVTGAPAPGGGPESADREALPPVTGLALYDTVSGQVSRYQVGSVHGLGVDDLAWADADTVLFSYGRVTRFSAHSLSSTDVATWVWRVGDAEPRREQGHHLDLAALTPGPDGDLTVGQNPVTHYASLAAAESGRGQVVRLPRHAGWGQVTVSGDRVAAVQVGPDASTVDGRNMLLTGVRPAHGGRASMRRIPTDFKAGTIVGWRRPDTVLVIGWRKDTTSLLSVDLARRTVRVVGRAQQTVVSSPSFQLAASLAPGGTVARPAPPLPPNHGALVSAAEGIGIAVLLLAVGGLLWWRRRARG